MWWRSFKNITKGFEETRFYWKFGKVKLVLENQVWHGLKLILSDWSTQIIKYFNTILINGEFIDAIFFRIMCILMKLLLNSWKTYSIIDIKILMVELIFKCSYDTNFFIFRNLPLMLTSYDLNKHMFSNIGALFEVQVQCYFILKIFESR